jgi:hypothetical protein
MTDNKRLKGTLEFDIADAPMLVHAMSIAACTAMMCGHKDAQKKLDAYKKVFAQFAPPEAAFFDEETWAEMGGALLTAKSFHVTVTEPKWNRNHWWSQGYIEVTIDDRRFGGGAANQIKRGGPEIEAIHNALAQLAPLDCTSTFDNKKELTW